MSEKTRSFTRHTNEKYLTAFLMGFFCLLISVIPIMIADGGYFIYYGDFNAQQIPFYNLANDAVRNGQFGWNWYTDLGSDLMTSYSFYLIGSPFFWLSTILPRSLVTLSLPFLLALKHGVATLTAYAYIRRFVRSKNMALVGAMLYAFSGFQVYNIFFNHFQDVTALFPLMLIAMEENINNNRKGIFALTVSLMAFVNYYFFTGQAVFLIIYYLFRMKCPDFHTSWKKFWLLLLEAVAGTMIACVVLLPTAVSIMGNYRVSEHLYGQSMVLYNDKTRIARIIQTFFMPVDVPARPNLFNSDNARWSSIGGYLPLFSMVGVITFMRTRKKHWAVKLSLVCIVCAFIPILNSAFYMFNASYYARWYYMPILIFAMMTAQTLDDENADPSPAIKICASMLIAFGIISCLPEKKEEEVLFFIMPRDILYVWLTLLIAVGFLIMTGYIFYRKRRNFHYKRLSVWSVSIASVICVVCAVVYGAVTPNSAKDYINSAIKGGDSVYENVSEDNFFRIDISEDRDNYPMIWGLPSMRAFQSVVESSIMNFYPEVNVQRDVASRPDKTHYTLRGLFSVKYYYQYKDSNSENVNIPEELPGFELVDENDYFEIYENKLYIPMGMAFNSYVTEENFENKSAETREKTLIHSLVLDSEQAEKYSDIMKETEISEVSALSKKDYEEICLERQKNASETFRYDSKGFESEITLDNDGLVFFSVPYSSGWSAEVNGKPVDVEKVSYGFMAVKGETGKNKIVFRYRTPALTAGMIISISGIVILAVYMIICTRKRRIDNYKITHCYDYDSCHRIKAHSDYCNELIRKNKEV
ncbi:MAG: YfhO family protein [Ruminococcus flavefaciens]|nr:YfhO family protein [Ruminococcus flavefaciens]